MDMYSWDEDTSSWYGDASYSFSERGAKTRSASASRAKAAGPRTYKKKGGPNAKIIDPKKHISSESKNPLIIAVDVTGSMASWPFEIFDRLPLLFNTLSQYREDLEICFAAIGDARVDDWPLQVTSFASGFDLEQQLKALYGEGGGGDAPESYGLFARWVNTHVTISETDEPPFLIVFGDINMHSKIQSASIRNYLGDDIVTDKDAIKEWNKVAEKWNTWYLRRPTGKKGDKIDHGVGVVLHAKIGDYVEQGDPLLTVHANDEGKLSGAQQRLLAAYDWSEDPVEPPPLEHRIVT
ncbi:MAG: hypothetical protein ACK2T7_12365 [Anaerolineales bacterium]